MFELTKDESQKAEGLRRFRQLEDFRLKLIEIETDWNRVVVAYVVEFGPDHEFEVLLDRFESWDAPRQAEYGGVNDLTELNRLREAEDEQRTKDIDGTLKPICSELVEHVRARL